jgi:hypothetical protein
VPTCVTAHTELHPAPVLTEIWLLRGEVLPAASRATT